jgi:hypothetical protein
MRSSVVDSETEFPFLKRIFMELQSDVMAAHELVARSWILSDDGQRFKESQQAAREAGSPLPKMDLETLETSISLKPTDMAGLWTCIYGVVDPGYWNPASWGPSTRTPRDLYDGLRSTSMYTLQRIISQFTSGPLNQRNLSADRRIALLNEKCTKPESVTAPVWPLPSPDMPLPSNTKMWEARADEYPMAYLSTGVQTLMERLGGIVPMYPNSQTSARVHAPVKQVIQDRTEASYSQRDDESQPMEDTELWPSQDGTQVSEQVGIQLDSDQLEIIGELPVISRDQSPCENKGSDTHTDAGSVLGSDPSDGNLTVFEDEHGIQFSKPDIDHEEDPGVSLDMAIEVTVDGDPVIITPEMLERVTEMCQAQTEQDRLVVAALIENGNAWERVTRQAMQVGELGPIGLAGLCLEMLDQTYRNIDDNIIYWHRRKAEIAQQMKTLTEQRKVIIENARMLADIKKQAIHDAHLLSQEKNKDIMASASQNSARHAPIKQAKQPVNRATGPAKSGIVVKSGVSVRKTIGSVKPRPVEQSTQAASGPECSPPATPALGRVSTPSSTPGTTVTPLAQTKGERTLESGPQGGTRPQRDDILKELLS